MLVGVQNFPLIMRQGGYSTNSAGRIVTLGLSFLCPPLQTSYPFSHLSPLPNSYRRTIYHRLQSPTSTSSRWAETAEKVSSATKKSNDLQTNQHFHSPGGKAKPLRAPKKEKKEMDEDEIAFREKQRAGA